jgi:iron-sulfur cluster repair protein YtfE (RIC family)
MKVLRKEHAEITRYLIQAGRMIRESPGPPASRLRSSVGRLRTLVEAHFAEEEETLYAALKMRLRRDSPVEEMTKEHEAIRRTLMKLVSASGGYAAGHGQTAEVGRCLSSLEEELEAHVQKEEKVLFWLADLRL